MEDNKYIAPILNPNVKLCFILQMNYIIKTVTINILDTNDDSTEYGKMSHLQRIVIIELVENKMEPNWE